jgi:predicted nucleic acid-binding protein
MLFDTDILIWYLRGNPKAAKAMEQAGQRAVSVVSYMELLQGARNKNEIKVIRNFLKDADFEIVPLSENIGHRASVYMEMFCLRVEMCLADALLAATAVENNLPLYTGNTKHYKLIQDMEIKPFLPE